MRRADFLRCKESRRNPVAHAVQVPQNLVEPQADMTADVFEEHDAGLEARHESTNVRPNVSRIARATLSAGRAERLAGVARAQHIHRFHSLTPPGEEGSRIVPNRRAAAFLVFQPRQEAGRGRGVPLDTAHNSALEADEFERPFDGSAERADSGANIDDGKLSHKIIAPRIMSPAPLHCSQRPDKSHSRLEPRRPRFREPLCR